MLLYATSSSHFASKISTAHHSVAVVFFIIIVVIAEDVLFGWNVFFFCIFFTKAIIIIHVFNPHKEREWSNSEYECECEYMCAWHTTSSRAKAIIIKWSAFYSLIHPLSFYFLLFFSSSSFLHRNCWENVVSFLALLDMLKKRNTPRSRKNCMDGTTYKSKIL